MSITIHPTLEAALRARAEAEGLTVEAYLERLVRADQEAIQELEWRLRALHPGIPLPLVRTIGKRNIASLMNA